MRRRVGVDSAGEIISSHQSSLRLHILTFKYVQIVLIELLEGRRVASYRNSKVRFM